jgi:hypothetical protein
MLEKRPDWVVINLDFSTKSNYMNIFSDFHVIRNNAFSMLNKMLDFI